MVDKFYCEKCTFKNTSLKTTYKSGYIPKKLLPRELEIKEEPGLNELLFKLATTETRQQRKDIQIIGEMQSEVIKEKIQLRERCENCSGCFRTANCDICTNCFEKKDCIRRICVNNLSKNPTHSSVC